MKNTEIEIKLEFIKLLLIGNVSDTNIVSNFFEKGEYPDEITINKLLKEPINPKRLEGMDEPSNGFTMIGKKRLDNLHKMLEYVRENNIDGDLIETGVWKGGATIFMKIYSDFYGMNKKIFVCDSFEGLPKPSGKFSADNGDLHHTFQSLKISLEMVKNSFKSFFCLDENVIFVKGFFKDTLPNNSQIGNISLLRMDGDMYESTHDVFYSTYDKLSNKGVLIIDDYCLPACKQCVSDFRLDKNISDEINIIDRCGIFWIKNKS